MGHLVNPIAYRLGHTRSWEDNWFIRNIYYPEFLHSMLKIRQYIHYFWTTRFMEKKGILLSHFYIYKFIKNLLVKIFLYNTDFEKYIYSFYARGVGIFSDSFYYRVKRKKKKKLPFRYERYKPDLFFSLFLYFGYFTKLKIKRRKKSINGFIYKCNKHKKLLKNYTPFKSLFTENRVNINEDYLDNLKKGNLNCFLNLSEKSNTIENEKNLSIPAYEEKIKLVSSKRLNLGFLDFLVYIFFKINMLEKNKEDVIRNKKKRKSVEMVLNYPLKIQKWIIILKKYIDIRIILGKKKVRRKRSLRNFIFFLTFLMNIISKIKRTSSRIKFRLRELNLKLVRLFLFNRVLTQFGFFYGRFLKYILYILTNMKKFNFKFCFITNNSVNAKFLTRYMGLKLKRKFPLFVVVNPLRKELRKLAGKKKEKKSFLLFNYFNSKNNLKKIKINYKESYSAILKHLCNKYLEVYVYYFKEYKMLITFDIYTYFLMLKNKYKYKMLLTFYKKKFVQYYKNNIWNLNYNKKKRFLNKKWIFFLKFLLENNKCKSFFINKKKILYGLHLYIKNKLLINLFFSYNKYHVDSIVNIFFLLKGDNDTFFFFNNNYVFLVIYSFFYNYSLLSYTTILNINTYYLITSNYLFKSFMFYFYVQYTFNKLIYYLNMNKRTYYLKMKKLYSSSSFFLGYKMSFKGRFSRKQRASSVWFHQGFVPLNTVKGFIDYSFFTIPLKNSAISIKLWLYKNTNKVIWDSKFLSKK